MASANLSDAAESLSKIFHNMGKQISLDDSMILVSRRVIKHLALPLLVQMGLTGQKSPFALLDNACGAGVVVQEIQAALDKGLLEKSSILCADSSDGMVGLVKRRIEAEGWINTEARVLDAMNTKLADNSFTHVTIALGLHIIPNPDAAVKDAIRVLRPGGRFGASTFPTSNQYMFWYPEIKSAFASFPFDAPAPEKMPLQMHESGRWYDTDWVREHLTELGLKDVEVQENPGNYRVESAEEFVSIFGMMLPWLMNTWWSEETRAAHPLEEVSGLITRHLEEKYGGEGWLIEWRVMSATGVVDK